MLVSISEGLCREGLFGAILFSAAVDIVAMRMKGWSREIRLWIFCVGNRLGALRLNLG